MLKQQKKSKKNDGESRSRPLRVAIIGGGRLGTAMGRALTVAGHKIEIVVAKQSSHARKAARLIGADTTPLDSRQFGRPKAQELKRIARSDVILITTPDDAIDAVVGQLSALSNLYHQTSRTPLPRVALHTSGAISSEILGPLRKTGLAIGSLHPLVSVSDPGRTATLFLKAFWCVEGDRAATRVARTIVRDLGGQSFTLDARRKALYHAAAVTSSGHIVALFDIALEMLSRCGLTARKAQQVLLPLLQSTAVNLSTREPARALTGTFARADLSTARRHLAAIQVERLTDALGAYLLLGRRSIRLARRAGTSKAGLRKVEMLLEQSAKDFAQPL